MLPAGGKKYRSPSLRTVAFFHVETQREEESAMPPACTVSLDFGLEADINMLRNTVRAFAVEKIAPCATELDWTSGSPTVEVQRVQGKLADIYTRLDASRTYVYATACDRSWTTRKDAASVVLFAAETATQATNEIRCIRIGRDLFKEPA
jgi:hypothetical protein